MYIILSQNTNGKATHYPQGLWPWMMNQIFTKKFWRSIKRDGFLLTHTRGHKAQMHAHSVGGYGDNAKFVGRDEFGNKYYEDFDAYRNQTTNLRLEPAQMGRVRRLPPNHRLARRPCATSLARLARGNLR